MKIEIVSDYEELSERAAEIVAAVIREQPRSLIVLPTGDTPDGLFRRLVAAHREGRLDFDQTHLMALDEWHGLPDGHPLSCRQILVQELVSQVNLPAENFYCPNSLAVDAEAECRRYSARLSALGPPALSVLGLGVNGHIGFNEPADRLPLATHVARLAPETVRRAARSLKNISPPTYGLTLGIGEVMTSRSILLLASGTGKAKAVRKMFEPLTTAFPASLLQLHSAVTVLLDQAAAGLLALDRAPELGYDETGLDL